MSGNGGRRNWTRSLTLVVAVAAAAVIGGYLIEGTAVGTDRHYLSNTAGAVLFDHGAHRRSADSCAVCHHPLYGATPTASCADCHDDKRDAAEFSHDDLKIAHGRNCGLCHPQKSGDDQASSCRACHPHVPQDETGPPACSTCHDAGYSPDIMNHDEYLDVEAHTCLGCHSPRSLADSYHINCSNCHLQVSSARFAQADGTVLCGACHLR